MIFAGVLVRSALPDWPALGSETRMRVIADVELFVRNALALAPFHVWLGSLVLSIAAGLFVTLLSPGLSPAGGSNHRAAALLAVFHRLPGPGGAIVRLYRSLTVLAFYEHPLVVAAMGVEDPSRHHDRFRAERARLLAEKAVS